MRERWKDIVGYEGSYQVSDLGRVRSLDRAVPHSRGGTQRLEGRVLVGGSFRKNGVVMAVNVILWKDGTPTTRTVHKVVLEEWVGPCPEGFEGCHGDGNPSNNVLSNLRWDTPRNNEHDKIKHGTSRIRCVRRSDGVEFDSIIKAAEETNCYATNIGSVCNGKRKTTGGYGWEYVENSI